MWLSVYLFIKIHSRKEIPHRPLWPFTTRLICNMYNYVLYTWMLNIRSYVRVILLGRHKVINVPRNRVFPPEIMTLQKKSFLVSMSQAMRHLYTIWCSSQDGTSGRTPYTVVVYACMCCNLISTQEHMHIGALHIHATHLHATHLHATHPRHPAEP